MAVAVNSILRGIIEDLKYEMKYARKHANMTDQYYQGYVDKGNRREKTQGKGKR